MHSLIVCYFIVAIWEYLMDAFIFTHTLQGYFMGTVAIHYSDIIMSTMMSKITHLMIVFSTVYSGADQRKYQNSVSLAIVREIHWWPVNSLHKGPGPCITNVFATRRKNFSQWHPSFQRKLLSHWLKFLRHVAITLVIQGPVTRHMSSCIRLPQCQ